MASPSSHDSQPLHPMQHEHLGVIYDYVFPKDVLKGMNEFNFDSTDVLVVGYPKTGTTWLQEIAWLCNNEADTVKAASVAIIQRVPLMELQFPGQQPMLETLTSRKSPRLMNTHLQASLLQKAIEKGKPKVIVILRNPKDTLVSYYHFNNTRHGFEKIPSFSKFFDLFKEKKLVFGDWFDHITSWLPNEGKGNFLFIKYEEMKVDHYGSVEKVAKFLNKVLSPEQLATIVDYTSLKSMKENESQKLGNYKNIVVDESKSAFVRKGIVGDWKNYFTEEQSHYIDNLIKKLLPHELVLNFD